VRHYVRRFSLDMGRDVRDVAPAAMNCLRLYSWPGNIRELQSILKQALLQAVGQTLIPEFLPPDLPQDVLESTGGEPVPHKRPGTTLSDMEHEAIQKCLHETGGNRQLTAQRLGISTRTLLRKIREYELDDPLRSITPDPGESTPIP
jgi:DNA-binding NtrC family response regulator